MSCEWFILFARVWLCESGAIDVGSWLLGQQNR